MPILSAPLLDVLAFVVPPCTCICCSSNTNNSKASTNPNNTITTTKAPTSTFVNPESETLFALQHRVFDMEKEVKELKQADLSTTHGASIRSEVPVFVNEYLGSSVGMLFRRSSRNTLKNLDKNILKRLLQRSKTSR
ncbi:hypothetical protein Tco_1170774 [Tanacetum coccineum]